MQYNAAFHLGIHCLQKYSTRGFPEYKRLTCVHKGNTTLKKPGIFTMKK